MVISIFCIAALSPILLLLIPLLFMPEISNSYLLLFSCLFSFAANFVIAKSYSWETNLEKTLNVYRMNIEEEKEDAFREVQKLIDASDLTKFKEYIENSQLYDERMEKYLNNKTS